MVRWHARGACVCLCLLTLYVSVCDTQSYTGDVKDKLRHGAFCVCVCVLLVGAGSGLLFDQCATLCAGQGSYVFPNSFFTYSGQWETGYMHGMASTTAAPPLHWLSHAALPYLTLLQAKVILSLAMAVCTVATLGMARSQGEASEHGPVEPGTRASGRKVKCMAKVRKRERTQKPTQD